MINGIIAVNKPSGWTSHDIVAKLRGIYKQKRIGHTGTLDPMATGLLIVCLGRATKLVDRITDYKKSYFVEFKLGYETDTEDITGEITYRYDKTVELSDEFIFNTINGFIGEFEQIPPMYSAIKINGIKLYELARKGEVVERKARQVNIFDVRDIKISRKEYTGISMIVECSKGTYIRSLVRDIGRKLGTYATMSELKRIKVGKYDIQTASTLDKIKNNPYSVITSMDECLSDYDKLILSYRCNKLLENGNPIPLNYIEYELDENTEYLVYNSNNKLIGIYKKMKNFLMPVIILKD